MAAFAQADSLARLEKVAAHPAWRDFLEALVVAVLLALFARTWVVQAYRVPSSSMSPGLLPGDHIVVNKLVFRQPPSRLLPARALARGDIAVFRLQDGTERVVVKRCVAVGGDLVQIFDKQLVVNDEPVTEPYAHNSDSFVYPQSRFLEPPLRDRDNFGPVQVPEGHCFWLGDNRDESQDSRHFGPTATSSIVGQPVWIAWSRSETGNSPARGPAIARSRGGQLLGGVVRYFESFRGSRFLRQVR